jgi:3-hydroxyisobutyrate dehydrogenase-like beta-hydroxyacid dehydrogenase
MHKDIRLALATAHDEHVVLPSAGVADEVLTDATETGYEHRDIAALHELLATHLATATIAEGNNYAN